MSESKYQEAFISEAQEHLDSLNEGILKLEKDPKNQDYINQVFRACHTLKGNAAMMGFNTFSELSHKMENLLASIRDSEIEVTQEITNMLLEASDILTEGLDVIREAGSDDMDTDAILGKLEKVSVKKQETKQETEDIPARLSLTGEQKEAVEEEKGKGNNVFRVVVVFNPTCMLKGPKTQILMRKSSGIYERVIYSKPEMDKLKEGSIEEGFDQVISTSKSKEDVENFTQSISEITGKVLSLEEDYKEPEKEKQKSQPAKAPSENKKDIINTIAKPIQSIKVDVRKLDNLVNIVGELLISNMRLRQISKSLDSPALNELINNVEMLTGNIQEEVMHLRMVPVGQIFNRFPRLVRDISSKENKKVDLVIKGEDIELDRNVIDEISEPLVHLLRNSVDHGIEETDERLSQNKPEYGTINLNARREKNFAIIEINDDGKGIDTKRVVDSAVSKGVLTAAEASTISKQKALSLIFHPGLSTKENVTDISGRGVGMDVVLTKIKKLGGNVRLKSDVGKGTKVLLQLPLTLAIISSLIVELSKEKYAIPLSNVVETIDLLKEKIRTIHGQEVIILRGEEVPLIRLSSVFNAKAENKNIYPTVITEESGRKVGFIVDKIINQQPILIKNLHSLIRGIKGIAGATILGDGKVCLILDIVSLTS